MSASEKDHSRIEQARIVWEEVADAEPKPRPHTLPSGSVEWETPDWLFELLDGEFHFTVDVASTHENAKCVRHFTKEDDVFRADLRGESIWCNPPYDAEPLLEFVRFLFKQTRAPGTTAVLLVPVKSDQEWWHSYAVFSEVRFIKGRIQFKGAKYGCPMPVCVIVMGFDVLPRMTTFEGPQLKLEVNQ